MSDEIRQNIDSYIYQEDSLLVQLTEINKQKGNIGSQITKEAASLIAREYFGRAGGKVARSLVDQSEKERIQLLLDEVDRQHRMIAHARVLVSTSEEKRMPHLFETIKEIRFTLRARRCGQRCSGCPGDRCRWDTDG